MSERPILMSAPMVQATLREIDCPGTGKTNTRRIIKPQPIEPQFVAGSWLDMARERVARDPDSLLGEARSV